FLMKLSPWSGSSPSSRHAWASRTIIVAAYRPSVRTAGGSRRSRRRWQTSTRAGRTSKPGAPGHSELRLAPPALKRTMISPSLRWSVWVLASCAALGGCAPSTNVSVATSTPSQYSHVYLPIQEVWFNTSSTATPEDTTWQKFPLTTPITVDLASLTSGALGQIATALKVPAGTYAQMRLIP